MTGAGPSLLQAAPRSDGRTGAHCSAARVRTQYHESLQNVSSVMRSGAKLIHKSSNNSGALPRIENYVGLRIESNELFAARQALLKSDGRFPVSHCCDLALLFGGICPDSSILRPSPDLVGRPVFSGSPEPLPLCIFSVAGIIKVPEMIPGSECIGRTNPEFHEIWRPIRL